MSHGNSVSEVSYPCRCPGKNELVGYEVSQSVNPSKVRDVKKVGDLVSKIAVNVSNISGVEFTLNNNRRFEAQARVEAIAEAKTKAKRIS